MLINRLKELNSSLTLRVDKENPANSTEFYANTYKTDSDGNWVNITESDIAYSDINFDTEKATRAMEYIRIERDKLLKQSDWTQGEDVPTAIKSAWTTYRQALRDVPSNYPSASLDENEQITGVTWPTKPE